MEPIAILLKVNVVVNILSEEIFNSVTGKVIGVHI